MKAPTPADSNPPLAPAARVASLAAAEQVTVIEAGVSGLTTAVVLPEADLRVIAEDIPAIPHWPPGLCGGPYLVEPKDKVDRWSQHSLEVFRSLADDPTTGVRITSGVEASRHADAPPEWPPRFPASSPAPLTTSHLGSPPAAGSRFP
jgi:D-amino-acid oxidase